MSRRHLKALLQTDIERWQAMTYEDLIGIKYPVVEVIGEKGERDYRVTEISLLEKTDAYIHLSLSLDDGGLTSFFPVSGSLIVRCRRAVGVQRE